MQPEGSAPHPTASPEYSPIRWFDCPSFRVCEMCAAMVHVEHTERHTAYHYTLGQWLVAR